MPQLMTEATAVNRAFSQQVLLRDGERHDCGQPHPFATGGDPEVAAGTAFRCVCRLAMGWWKYVMGCGTV